MDNHDLLRPALAGFDCKRLTVAFSGGMDSTVLLHLAVPAAASSAPAPHPSDLPASVPTGTAQASSTVSEAPLRALHINHGLHPDADRWEAHCAAVCNRLGTPFLSRRVQVEGGNLEAAARRARYRAFNELLGPGDLLLLGHHQDDQAETLLMRLLQGRDVRPMPRSRRLAGGAVILRPLLNTPRRKIRRLAEDIGATWIEDPSNSARRFDRNFLRLEILPRLASHWPNVKPALVNAGRAKAAHDALLAHLLDGDSLALGELPSELHVPALRAWLVRFGETGAGDRALAEFAAQINARVDAQPELRLAHGSLRRWRGAVRYAPSCGGLESSYALQPPGVLSLPHGELSIKPAKDGGFHAKGAVQVRFRQGGECLRMGGRSRSLKTLLQAASVPPWERGVQPLIFQGDELLAVPGVAVADLPAGPPRWQAAWTPNPRASATSRC